MLIAAVCILIHRTKSDAVVERDAASQGEGLFSVVDAYCIQVSRETYRYEVNETFSGRNVEWTSACTCNGGVPDFSNYEAAADEGDDLGDLMAYAAEEGESHTFTGPIVCMDRQGHADVYPGHVGVWMDPELGDECIHMRSHVSKCQVQPDYSILDKLGAS
eukprot:CAMPEP_0116540736 /NCGR_PEP_ID=MMETSP0397-20121206/108_1 /TAXON_ID=216820 /ORGANISM="Cyclophora tenuis, Strain ECT3854" /LENGTH=160 /DNA_ID=CAMNT_0004064631 /DNA_START=70 /DNA_END=553 /DNA_ORIENTATION=-